mmetsp:Transcript_10238/g.21952  ORF Transcript_10238/g.21952 Transcript_10238/m.21952 type:complete len:85 (-) Transcript_10238:1173-1427(-)
MPANGIHTNNSIGENFENSSRLKDFEDKKKKTTAVALNLQYVFIHAEGPCCRSSATPTEDNATRPETSKIYPISGTFLSTTTSR